MDQAWPTVEIDSLRRLRVLAAAAGTPMYAEEHIPAPFETVWAVAGDLEHELPGMVRTLKSFGIDAVDGDRVRARAVRYLGQHEQFDVVLRPGWCVMQSRLVLGGMAAIPEDGGTRFAILGGLRPAGVNKLQRLLSPLGGPRPAGPSGSCASGSAKSTAARASC